MQASTHEDMSWTVAGAKAKLSEVMERAQLAPQTITRNGKPSVVVVSAENWAQGIARGISVGIASARRGSGS